MSVNPASDQTVTQQPSQSLEELPKGLQKLQACSSIVIQQDISTNCCIRCFCQQPNSYQLVSGDDKEFILSAQEGVQCVFRSCCGAGRWMSLKFYDVDEVKVGYLDRPQVCSRGCCGWTCCCLPEMIMTSPPRKPIGRIVERWTCLSPKYDIYNWSGDVIMTFSTQCCYLDCRKWFSDPVIQVLMNDEKETEAATISKQTQRNSQDFWGTENNIHVKFHSDLDLQQKLMIIGAAFLVDFNNFESDKRCWC